MPSACVCRLQRFSLMVSPPHKGKFSQRCLVCWGELGAPLCARGYLEGVAWLTLGAMHLEAAAGLRAHKEPVWVWVLGASQPPAVLINPKERPEAAV